MKSLAILILLVSTPSILAAAGSFKVGSFKTDRVKLVDNNRASMRVWYPSQKATNKKTRYVTTIPSFITGIPPLHGIATERPLADCSKPRPVIIFSHGDEGLKDQSWTSMEALASHGFIVAAIDHVGNTQFNNPETKSLLPSFLHPLILQNYRFDLERTFTYFRRPLDLSSAYDWLLENFLQTIEFQGKDCFDREHPGYVAWGHSTGAMTAMMAGGASSHLSAAQQYCEDQGSILFNQAKVVMCNSEKVYQSGSVSDPSSFKDIDANGDGKIEPRIIEAFNDNRVREIAKVYDGKRISVADPRVKAVVAVFPCCREMIVGGTDTLHAPTLVIGGENDAFMPINREFSPLLQEMLDADRDATGLILKQADHTSFAEMCDLLASASPCRNFRRDGNLITLLDRNDFPNEFTPNTRFVYHSEWCDAYPNDHSCLLPDLVRVVADDKVQQNSFDGSFDQVSIEVMDFDLSRIEIQIETLRFLSSRLELDLPSPIPERTDNWLHH